jgi:hypothetical protein
MFRPIEMFSRRMFRPIEMFSRRMFRPIEMFSRRIFRPIEMFSRRILTQDKQCCALTNTPPMCSALKIKKINVQNV